jgi:L-fuculose-phosphate aldolase
MPQHGLNYSHSGNGSVRLGDSFIVTKTGACADTIQTAELVRCEFSQKLPSNASLDAGIHQYIYQTLENCGAVLHAHNPYTIALTLNAER